MGRDVAGGLVLPGPAVTTLGPLLSDAEAAQGVGGQRVLRKIDAAATDDIAEHLPGYVTQACTALLDGKPVGLGLGEFPTLHPLDVV